MKIDGAPPRFPLPLTSALVVEPNETERQVIASALKSQGFLVRVTDSFSAGKALLSKETPALLVAEIRLGAYNGLQLAYHGRSTKGRMTMVLMSGYPDPVLQRDAERIGATFVLKPVTIQDLLVAVYRTALQQPNSDGTYPPVQAPFERRQADRRRSEMDGVVESERRQVDRRRSPHLRAFPK